MIVFQCCSLLSVHLCRCHKVLLLLLPLLYKNQTGRTTSTSTTTTTSTTTMTSLGDVNSGTAASTQVTSSAARMTMTTPEDQLRQRQERAALMIQACFVRFLLVFQAITQMYVTHCYLVDFAFGNCSSVTRTALKAWAWHLCVVGTVNWLCLLYYRSVYNPAKHRPDRAAPSDNAVQQTLHLNHSEADDQNCTPDSTTNRPTHTDHNLPDPKDNRGSDDNQMANSSRLTGLESSEGRPLPWTYCQRCQMSTPPRTRHCKKCEVCIIRRDHHCELVGVCVGHRNQRFFVVLANYGLFVCYIGAYMTLTFLYHHHPEGSSLWNYFLPVTFFQGVAGNISGLQLLLTYHAYMLVAFCPLCTVYFLSEMSVILQGKTMQEVLKRRKSIRVTTGLQDNLRVAFGDRWWLGFLFPTHLILPHTHTGLDFPGVTDLDSLPESGAGLHVQQQSGDKKQD